MTDGRDKQEKRNRQAGGEVNEFPSAAFLKRALDITEDEFIDAKVNELSKLLWLPASLPEKEKFVRITRAVELLESLAPADGPETMLALQMVASHSAALECMRRALHPDQTLATFEANLKNGEKLMALYLRQLEALNRHRGKGQQKVTVEYVNVEAGAQAIVGSVEAPQRRGAGRLHGRHATPLAAGQLEVSAEPSGQAIQASKVRP